MVALDQPLDLNASDAQAFLESIQGNILASHGRDFAAQIFVRFRASAGKTDIQSWIKMFAAEHVTSAAAQQAMKRDWKAKGGPGELFASLLLSHAGYIAAGVPASAIPVEAGRTYFQRGMKNQAAAERPFNDPPAGQWDASFQGDIHALVLLAHDGDDALTQAVADVSQSLSSIADAIWVERGRRVTFVFQNEVKTIEHFGFEDGISQPLFIMKDVIAERAARGFDKWDAAVPLSLVLKAEPGHPDRFGSFFVFRKLEQNVRGFQTALADLSRQFDLGPDGIEQAGAMAVGRFRDGTPIVPTHAPQAGAKLNNFNFAADDPAGAICPFHAHIRKTNPRGDLPIGIEAEKGFRIARRGITYGDRPDLAADAAVPPPDRGVGLLFMSYQARLDNFAIQQEGSDSNDFARSNVGVDAVIGQQATPTPQEWPTGSGRRFTMANFVTMRGGEYFFAPSMPFLKSLD